MAIMDMAKLLGPDDPAVRSVIDEGRGILEELEAGPLLAQLDALQGGATSASRRSGSRAGERRESTPSR
jgi:hypothetical protein